MVRRSVGRAVRREALEEVPHGKQEDERQGDSLGLGRVERALERCLRRAPIAELFAGGVKHLCLARRGWPVDHRGGTIDHLGEHVSGLVGLTLAR